MATIEDDEIAVNAFGSYADIFQKVTLGVNTKILLTRSILIDLGFVAISECDEDGFLNDKLIGLNCKIVYWQLSYSFTFDDFSMIGKMKTIEDLIIGYRFMTSDGLQIQNIK